jgi:RNA polymerase-interacting CarD/CdnL/TRCF family regulator
VEPVHQTSYIKGIKGRPLGWLFCCEEPGVCADDSAALFCYAINGPHDAAEKDYRRFAGMLGPGDVIFHPRYGFGAISGLTRRDPRHPNQDRASAGASDQTQEYYDIQLMDGGTLLVPVSRAESLGLRLLTNGVAAITICLHSPAQSLPEDARKRAAELQARGQNGEPTALAAAVRDMLAQSRGRALRNSEKAWLDKSCERLSTEAALVDRISRSQAHAAIREAVTQLSAP